MPKSAAPAKPVAASPAKPAANSAIKPEKKAAVTPKTVKKAAPAPAIKENAAAVKADAKKIKADAKAKVKAKAKNDTTAATAAKTEKPRKPKLVRDSFTMPADEYAVLGEVKKACLKAGVAVKKSELLRVGVALIRKLDAAALKVALEALPVLKAGRPKKGK
jgi:hypothetical protein